MKKLVIYVTILLVILISDGHSSVHRNKRQIVENGIRVTDLWLKFLFDWFPDYFPGQLMSTPVLFLPQIKRLPAEILRLLNLPVPTYESTSSPSSYSLTSLVQSLFGVDIFTLTFIATLYFLASLAAVAIVLPNLYFKLMLWADVTEDAADIYDNYDY
eukprot:09889.XXX_434114_434920_1 [CDS] Oithona nana genome sequencing.